MVSFDPFLNLYGLKTLTIAQLTLLGPILALLNLLLAFFAIFAIFRTFLVIFLLNKASDERVGGGPSFLDERGVALPSFPTHFELCIEVEH
jgi:hypothetical protein